MKSPMKTRKKKVDAPAPAAPALREMVDRVMTAGRELRLRGAPAQPTSQKPGPVLAALFASRKLHPATSQHQEMLQVFDGLLAIAQAVDEQLWELEMSDYKQAVEIYERVRAKHEKEEAR
jgi:hypothetical protein